MKWFISCLIIASFCSCNSKSSKPEKSVEVYQHQKANTGQGISSEGQHTTELDKMYCNDRYGYCVSYPENVVKMLPEAENGDGRVFNSEEGTALGRIYRSPNADPEAGPVSLKQQMDRDIEYLQENKGAGPGDITYSKTGKDFYVISGKTNGRIYYRKVIVKNDETATLLFEYDEQQKSKYDVIVAAMSKSFHW